LTFGLVSFPVRLHIAARKERVRMHYLRSSREAAAQQPVEEQAPEPAQGPNGRITREKTEEPRDVQKSSDLDLPRFPVARIRQEFVAENDERPIPRQELLRG